MAWYDFITNLFEDEYGTIDPDGNMDDPTYLDLDAQEAAATASKWAGFDKTQQKEDYSGGWSFGSLLDEPGILDTAGGYLKSVGKLFEDNPNASKAIMSLLGGYFMSEKEEDAMKLKHQLDKDLVKLRASLSSGGSSGPPAATTVTNKGPGRIKRGS